MRKQIFRAMNKLYALVMSVAFFGGILPIIPFIAAIIIGGEAGANISNFLYKQYYPWVIALASIAIIIGLIAMYIGKLEGLSMKKIIADEGDAK